MLPIPRTVALVAALALAVAGTAAGQTFEPRILEQDPSLDNLVDPPGYETAPLGTLGDVLTRGSGPRPMVLVPGLGFGGGVFSPLMDRWADDFTMHAVTLPGFGGTSAPPSPAPGTSFGEQSWTRGALEAMKALVLDEDLRDVIVVGHWLTGTQIALRLAMEMPDRISGVVLLSGSARWVAPDPDPQGSAEQTLAQRVAGVDEALGPGWFKTVTRATWDDNNFLPPDYAEDPVLGLRMWREAAKPPLHVWVRYLCEFLAQDVTLELDALEVPTLLVRPGLQGLVHDPGGDYLTAYAHRSWGGVLDAHDTIEVTTLPDTRIVMWADRPELVARSVADFTKGVPQ